MPYISATIVLVNYNTSEHVRTCLAALEAQTQRQAIVVVDNASTDGQIGLLHREFPQVRFIPLRRNVGFARAVNIVAHHKATNTEVLVTLNPDTVPRPDFVEALLDPLSNPSVSAVAGTLVFASDPDVIASAGVDVYRTGLALDARLGQPLATSTLPAEVFGPSGGAAAYRLDAFRQVGGFCDAFFLYLEDVDLAWRLRLCGHHSIWTPDAVATHAYSAAAGEGSTLKRRLLARNRVWTIARCLPDVIWRRDRAAILAFDAKAVAWAAAHRDMALLRGRAEGIARLPPRLCERRAIQRAACVSPAELMRWIQPALADRELLALRDLTRRYAVQERALP
ncbi:MAG: glycosyltransferase family 2 protein [Chloroflexi bacterium]|nr:MAG: glycosyltransferase family 2 protein [Chloroflexota bacterium]